MKKYLFLFLVSITFISCSNDDDTTNITTSERIIGVWNWVQSTGGIDGTTYTPESIGETIRFEISSNTSKVYTNGDLSSETTYTIETRESVIYNEPREMFTATGDTYNYIIEFSTNKLFLTGDCNDCYTAEYTRE